MASIHKRSGVWHVYYRQNGKRIRYSLETRNERVAKDQLKKIEYELMTGQHIRPQKTLLIDFPNDFLAHLKNSISYRHYRRLIVLLRRDGWLDNHKRIERIYREEGLQVPKRKKRKTAYKHKEKPSAPIRMNERWSMDFVHDATAQGHKLRMLNIVDDYTREGLWLDAGATI